MDLAVAVALLASILGLIILGGGGWLLHNLGWRHGYREGVSEAIPAAGDCGNCGQSFEGGTMQDVISRIVEHDCPAAQRDD